MEILYLIYFSELLSDCFQIILSPVFKMSVLLFVNRAMGVSTSSSAARLGSFSASYVVWLVSLA